MNCFAVEIINKASIAKVFGNAKMNQQNKYQTTVFQWVSVSHPVPNDTV